MGYTACVRVRVSNGLWYRTAKEKWDFVINAYFLEHNLIVPSSSSAGLVERIYQFISKLQPIGKESINQCLLL